MTAISVVLDASNIAFTKTESGGKSWIFSRVEEVREAWRRRDPDGQVHAVIDASVRTKLVDKPRAARAETDGWLEVAPGDADDVILRLAETYDAAIVSRDNFTHARVEHPWLQGCSDRVFSVVRKAEAVHLRRRHLGVASPADIEVAKRKKLVKAGLVADVGDRRWRCMASPHECEYGGAVLPATKVRQRGRRWFCHACQGHAEEILTAEPAPSAVPASVSLMHRTRFQGSYPIPSDGFVLGRGDDRRPEVVDVTAGLPRTDALEVSGEHVRVSLDDDGRPVVVHLAPRNVSFLNPVIDADGLPANNRLVPGEEYPLVNEDILLLGPGLVRLVVSTEPTA